MPERIELRRRDRARDDAWIRAFLERAPFGYLATAPGGRPLLNSNLFVYDEAEHAVYLHTARTGRTPETASASAPAAFSAAVMGRLLPAPTALEFSVEYASVVAFGPVEAVGADAEKRRFLENLLRKYAPHLEPGRDYRPITNDELARTAVHRLRIERWAGKEKVAPPDLDRAYAIPVPRPPILTAGTGREDVRGREEPRPDGDEAPARDETPRPGAEPELVIPAEAALVLVDLQAGFGPAFLEHWAGPGGRRNQPDAEEVAGRLLRAWREAGRPVVHVRHDSTEADSPLRPGRPGNAFAAPVRPVEGEPVYAKHVNSAFIGTRLEADLRSRGIHTLVMAGIQTNHCLSTTARMAGNLGFRTIVVSDACATFDRTGPDGRRHPADLMHRTALASLHGEFAAVASAGEVLRSVGRDGHASSTTST